MFHDRLQSRAPVTSMGRMPGQRASEHNWCFNSNTRSRQLAYWLGGQSSSASASISQQRSRSRVAWRQAHHTSGWNHQTDSAANWNKPHRGSRLAHVQLLVQHDHPQTLVIELVDQDLGQDHARPQHAEGGGTKIAGRDQDRNARMPDCAARWACAWATRTGLATVVSRSVCRMAQ